MTTAPAQQPLAEQDPVRSLTRGQKVVLALATIPMIAVGVGGAIGTYANAASELHRAKTAIGVVAAGEGATLVAAIVMVGVTMLGQAAPLVVRAALWLLPAAASVMGLTIASNSKEAVVYALTPLAMTASAEGISFLARRIVAHTTGVDVEAQRRNAETMRQIAYHQARAKRHPDEKVRAESDLKAWKLMSRIGEGDAQLGSGLIEVQRSRLTEGADTALQAMLYGSPEPVPSIPVSRALEPGEPTVEPPREPTAHTLIQPADQQVSREPVLSPAEPAFAKTLQTAPEPTADEPDEPETGADEKEQQIAALAHRLTIGERLSKSTAAQILGVSPATAGRRLKDARDRISDGTGMYL